MFRIYPIGTKLLIIYEDEIEEVEVVEIIVSNKAVVYSVLRDRSPTRFFIEDTKVIKYTKIGKLLYG